LLIGWRIGYLHLESNKDCTCNQCAIVGAERGVPLCDICRADLIGFFIKGTLWAPLLGQVGSKTEVGDPEYEHPAMKAKRHPNIVELGEKRFGGYHP